MDRRIPLSILWMLCVPRVCLCLGATTAFTRESARKCDNKFVAILGAGLVVVCDKTEGWFRMNEIKCQTQIEHDKYWQNVVVLRR